MGYIERAIKDKFISFDADQKNVIYEVSNKKYRYTDPEEKVRVEIYLSLIYDYGYDPRKMRLEFKVPHRTPNNLADIVVFNDDKFKDPYIVVEVKKGDVSEAEFRQAIEQGFGNANSLKANYLWISSGIKSEYFNVEGFPSMEREKNKIADIPKEGKDEVAKFKYAKGGVNGMELKKVKEDELTRIFKQVHDALWAGGKRNPSEAFDELDKLIFCKIEDERAARKDGDPYDFQVFSNEVPETLLKRVKAIYNKGKKKDPEVFQDDIRLKASELETVVGYLASININKSDFDSKGRAFETFMGSFFRGEFGQYFTPRPIVEFIVDNLPINNESNVLDPSCGSGGFLLYALNKVRDKADSMATEGYFEKNGTEWKDHWHKFAENNLFGIEISENIARTAKMNMIIHDDGHTNVISMDGLEDLEKMKQHAIRNKSKGYDKFKKESFDYIITNPPFGSSIKYSENRYVEDYELGVKNVDWIDAKLKNINLNETKARDRQSSEIMFIERCHQFLKDGGIMAMVIPDGILTNSSLQYVRDWILENYKLLAVVSMPQTAFMATDANVKSSVIFLRKYSVERIEAIRQQKQKLQDELYERPVGGVAIIALEEEKKKTIKKGNTTVQGLEEALVRHLEALEAQGTLDGVTKKKLIKANKDKVKKYQKTDSYKDWKKEVSDEYNEKINTQKEVLQDLFVEEIKSQVENYEIFMAIADDIGYDSTGKPTYSSELSLITKDLKQFIQTELDDVNFH